MIQLEDFKKRSQFDFLNAKEEFENENFFVAMKLAYGSVENLLKYCYLKKFGALPEYNTLTELGDLLSLDEDIIKLLEELDEIIGEYYVSENIPPELYDEDVERIKEKTKEILDIVKYINDQVMSLC